MTVRGADYARAPLDDYPTPPEVTDALLEAMTFGRLIWEPACGRKGLMMRALRHHGHRVIGTDVVFGKDFLVDPPPRSVKGADVVTNPPYGDRRGTLAVKFVERALEVTKPWKGRVAMLLPVDFDSGSTREKIFKHRAFASKIVLTQRIRWFDGQAGSTNHAWFIWDWSTRRRHPIVMYSRMYS